MMRRPAAAISISAETAVWSEVTGIVPVTGSVGNPVTGSVGNNGGRIGIRGRERCDNAVTDANYSLQL